MLHLKDFEIYKSNKISQFDKAKQNEKSNENKDIRKSLSQILIKSEQKNNNNNLTNSCDFKNRNINFKICDKTQENSIMNRQLSERIILRRNHINKNISNLIYYFNKKKKYSDQIITRGSRNEKGGVVDFSTVSPKKYYRNDRYIRNYEEGGYKSRNEVERPEEKINLKKRNIRPPNIKNNDMDDYNDNIDENNNNNQQEMIEKNKEDEDEIS